MADNEENVYLLVASYKYSEIKVTIRWNLWLNRTIICGLFKIELQLNTDRVLSWGNLHINITKCHSNINKIHQVMITRHFKVKMLSNLSLMFAIHLQPLCNTDPNEFLLFTHFYCLTVREAHHAYPFKGKQSLSVYWLLWMATPAFHLFCGRIYGGPMSLWELNQWSLVMFSEQSSYRVDFTLKTAWEWSHWAFNKGGRMGKFDCMCIYALLNT